MMTGQSATLQFGQTLFLRDSPSLICLSFGSTPYTIQVSELGREFAPSKPHPPPQPQQQHSNTESMSPPTSPPPPALPSASDPVVAVRKVIEYRTVGGKPAASLHLRDAQYVLDLGKVRALNEPNTDQLPSLTFTVLLCALCFAIGCCGVTTKQRSDDFFVLDLGVFDLSLCVCVSVHS